MTKEIWYRKVGRKYVPVLQAEHYDYMTMPAQGYTLTYRRDGLTQYEYAVKPDNASFVAAAMVARESMEAAIKANATYRPQTERKYTKKQLALVEQFKIDMGWGVPGWWQMTSAHDIAQAGIDAVGGAA